MLQTRKALEQSTKKSLATMSTQLAEAQAAQRKAESQSFSQRDLFKGLKAQWAKEVKDARDEWIKGLKQEQKAREEARGMHLALVSLVQNQA
jgi:hypothetical protein